MNTVWVYLLYFPCVKPTLATNETRYNFYSSHKLEAVWRPRGAEKDNLYDPELQDVTGEPYTQGKTSDLLKGHFWPVPIPTLLGFLLLAAKSNHDLFSTYTHTQNEDMDQYTSWPVT